LSVKLNGGRLINRFAVAQPIKGRPRRRKKKSGEKGKKGTQHTKDGLQEAEPIAVFGGVKFGKNEVPAASSSGGVH